MTSRIFIQNANLNDVLGKMQQEAKLRNDRYFSLNQLNFEGARLISKEGLEKGYEGFELTAHSLSQLSNRLEIPNQYFNYCLENGAHDELARNLNYWIDRKKEGSKDLLFRLQNNVEGSPKDGGRIRAVLSDLYGILNNNELLEIMEHFLSQTGLPYTIASYSNDNDGTFGMRVTIDREFEIGTLPDGRTPDIHQLGFYIRNSEVGNGTILVEPLAYRLICTNGLMGWASNGGRYKRRHVFSNVESVIDDIYFTLKSSLESAKDYISLLHKAKEIKVENPIEQIEKVAKQLKYTNKLTDEIKAKFEVEPVDNVFYLVQAFTRASQEYHEDRRTEIDKDATKLLLKLVS